jgi:hypothetical protein
MKTIVICFVLALTGAVVSLAGERDAAWSPVVYPDQRLPLVFSHQKHLARGTKCEACHPDATTSRSSIDNLIPTEMQCRACHPIDRTQPTKAATPVAACTGCHLGWTPDAPVARVYLTPSPLKFDHSAHAKQTCESCHKDIRQVELATTRQLPTMSSCFSCHRQDTRACTTCHLAATGGLVQTSFAHGRLVPSSSSLGDEHGPDFARDHKQQARRLDATCDACHDRSECVECHEGAVKPLEFHPANYLLVHAVDARRGRPDCSACHRAETFCIACHERSGLGTRGESQFNSRDPLQQFHAPNWASQGGGPATNLHAAVAKRSIGTCASCHREDDCLKCHSAEAGALKVSPHPAGWRGSARCRALDRGNRRMCLRCHVTDDELGCDWTK